MDIFEDLVSEPTDQKIPVPYAVFMVMNLLVSGVAAFFLGTRIGNAQGWESEETSQFIFFLTIWVFIDLAMSVSIVNSAVGGRLSPLPEKDQVEEEKPSRWGCGCIFVCFFLFNGFAMLYAWLRLEVPQVLQLASIVSAVAGVFAALFTIAHAIQKRLRAKPSPTPPPPPPPHDSPDRA